MALMDIRFRESGEDLLLRKLSQWNDMEKRKGEDVRLFWIRFDRLVGQLGGMGITWTPMLIFLKAYHALDMSIENRTMITATLQMAQNPQRVHELKRLPIRLFDVKTETYHEDTYALDGQPTSDSSSAQGEEDELSMTLTNHRIVKSKPRAGNMERSAQAAKAPFGMRANGAGSEECLRCGSEDRWWRNCRKPFDKTIVPPSKREIDAERYVQQGSECSKRIKKGR